jgi:hypothetical protein
VDDLVLLDLTPTELRVFLALRHDVDRWGESRASMEMLGELTGYGRTTLSKAVAGLVRRDLIRVHRKKRDFGRLSWNVYTVVPCSPERTRLVIEPKSPRSRERTSTRVLNKSLEVKLTKTINTEVAAPRLEESMNRWQDDDDLPGVGLLDAVSESDKSKPLSKKSAKNRSERPQAEWTANDVAVEFSFRVYARMPQVPRTIDTNTLRMRLSVNRKKYGQTAAQEMAAMDKFFADERNYRRVEQNPAKAHFEILQAIATYIRETTSPVVAVPVDITVAMDYIEASDGRKFENNMPGRAALKRYEDKLKG